MPHPRSPKKSRGRPRHEAGRLAQPDPSVEAGDEGVLYIGIDLGTSRTSVSASNGVRETASLARRLPQGRRVAASC